MDRPISTKIKQTVLNNVYKAIENGDINRLKDIFTNFTAPEATKTLHVRQKWGCDPVIITPLILAIKSNRMEMAQWLLKNYKLDVEQTQDTDDAYPYILCPNETALWYCVQHGNLPMTQLLVNSYQANINSLAAASSTTPLELACYHGYMDLVIYFLEMKADTCIVMSNGSIFNTCLMRAIASNKKEVVELLIQRGANVNQIDVNGGSALHMAAYFGHENITRLLLSSAASTSLEDRFGLTPIDVAILQGNESTFQLMLDFTQSRETDKKEQHIRLLELMGANFGILFSSKENRTKCYQYLHKAIKQRFTNDSESIPKKTLAPQGHYGYRMEHSTLEGLNKLRGVVFQDPNDSDTGSVSYEQFPLARESLIVLERILGQAHPYIAYKLADVVHEHGIEIHNEISLLLIKRSLAIMQEFYENDQNNIYAVLLNTVSFQTVLKVFETEDRFHYSFHDLKTILKTTMQIHENQTHWAKYSVLQHFDRDDDNINYQVIELSLRAMFLIIMHLPQRGKTWKQFVHIVSKFVKLTEKLLIQKESNSTALHILFQKEWPERMNQTEFFTRLTEVFLDCGAHPNSMDVHHMTPVDVINSSSHLSLVVKTKCIQLLVNRGAKTEMSNIMKTHALW